MQVLTNFEQHPCVIRVINTLHVGIYTSIPIDSSNIYTFTMALYQRQKYAVGEGCFHDATVSNPVWLKIYGLGQGFLMLVLEATSRMQHLYTSCNA